MEMKKPEINVVHFGAEDILTASGSGYLFHVNAGTYSEFGGTMHITLAEHNCNNTYDHMYVQGKFPGSDVVGGPVFSPSIKAGDINANYENYRLVNPEKVENPEEVVFDTWYYYVGDAYHQPTGEMLVCDGK